MKNYYHLWIIALRQVTRHRMRSFLTVAGVGVGLFLFTVVESMQSSLASATKATAGETTLVVYRENRYCPTTSRLPEHYLSQIRKIEGVVEAIPIQIAVNNCGASLDVIAFRGVPQEQLLRYNPDIEVIAGDVEAWERRGDGALVGENFAARRNLDPGDTFEAVGVRVTVEGVIRSPHPQDNNVAYVHLPFLQQATRVGLGTVTQFNVRVEDPGYLDSVASRIDTLFAADSAPTNTRPEKAFFAETAKDMIEMIQFTRWLGIAALFGVIALVSNALLLSARARVREAAILQTLGYSRSATGLLVVHEGILLGIIGGVLGSGLASVFLNLQSFTVGNEGLTLALTTSGGVVAGSVVLACLLGLVASLWPAFVAASQPIVRSLRSS